MKKVKIGRGLPILVKVYNAEQDSVHCCPVCKRYVEKVDGHHICAGCGATVNNNHLRYYDGKIIYDGGRSWQDVKRMCKK